jgi:hypothetical protein
VSRLAEKLSHCKKTNMTTDSDTNNLLEADVEQLGSRSAPHWRKYYQRKYYRLLSVTGRIIANVSTAQNNRTHERKNKYKIYYYPSGVVVILGGTYGTYKYLHSPVS